mgnify:CR=1 FL=1
MASLELRGAEPLIKALQTAANNKAHQAIVKNFGGKLQRSAKRNATFKKGYSTGATKRKISLEITEGGFTAKVEAGTEYSGYLEKGTRFMEAQPFMKPALNEIEPQFIAELRRAAIVK